jgi:hypothetical protein
MRAIDTFVLENDHLKVSVAPALGGKILSVYNKPLRHEFLWTNKNLPLVAHDPGTEYDPNFFGGIDELIPNDIPESIDGIAYPDHGELWTTRLQHQVMEHSIRVYGQLSLSKLEYSKTVSLNEHAPEINLSYTIKNSSGERRNFMWKMHAALNIQAGDKLITTAKKAKVADPEYSRFKKENNEFYWPHIENTDASIIPAKNGTMDFFYLFDTPSGEMQLLSEGGHLFSYSYGTTVFPYQWLFASYGGFLNHYTAILEPCTNMPMCVNDAISLNQSASLDTGESLQTKVIIFAGEKNNYITK